MRGRAPISTTSSGLAFLAEVYGLGEACVLAHELLLGLIRLVAEEGLAVVGGDELDDLTGLVGEVAVTESIADAAARFSSRQLGALRELSGALHERARGRARAGCAYLRARTAEHLGLTEEGEALLHEALDTDRRCRPALLDAAWYAEDRGDAARGLSLLRRAAVPPDDPQGRRLEAQASPVVAAKVARNDPCPCGSGRKYKVCCQRGGGQRPLGERAGWLLDKAGTYAHRPMNRRPLLPLLEARAGDPTDLEWVAAAMRDPLVQDLALFEEEVFDDFLDDRGVLLPADELELGRAWAGTPRSLYEIVEVHPEEALVLLDLRTGARVRVVERIGTRTMRAGGACDQPTVARARCNIVAASIAAI
ncbi:MAG: YecA family protein [Egibacteraceae bacterium]